MKVLALECCSEFCDRAREAASGMAVQVEHALSCCVQLKEQVDVVISEPYDLFFTGEHFRGVYNIVINVYIV